MIWGHYIIGKSSSDLSMTFSNVLEPYWHPNTGFSKTNFFCVKKANFRYFLYTKNLLKKRFVEVEERQDKLNKQTTDMLEL